MPAKLDRCVKQIIERQTKKYRTRYKKAPSQKLKKKWEEHAWPICRKAIGASEGGDVYEETDNASTD